MGTLRSAARIPPWLPAAVRLIGHGAATPIFERFRAFTVGTSEAIGSSANLHKEPTMKNKILSACIAALLFAACDDSKPKPILSIPEPVAVAPEASFIHDAGSMTKTDETPAKETDPIAIEHDHRGKVDHLAKAKELKNEGDVEGALAEARRQVGDVPGDEAALEQVARLALKTGQRELAVQAFGRLGSVRTDDATPLVQQARVLVSMGDNEGAVKAGTEAISRDDGNVEAHQVVGRAYLAAGELEKAIPCFQKVLELAPEHGFAMNNLGFAYLRANENEKAVEVLTRAAELLPNVAYVHNNLGVALERTGKIEDAKLSYAKSTSLSPKYMKAKINSERVAKAAKPTEEPTETEKPSQQESPMPELEMPQE
jgi:tetratricopeptide (TPR) repeat protein